jgi:hypothetical protein
MTTTILGTTNSNWSLWLTLPRCVHGADKDLCVDFEINVWVVSAIVCRPDAAVKPRACSAPPLEEWLLAGHWLLVSRCKSALPSDGPSVHALSGKTLTHNHNEL